jgi:hypothetical protein
MEIGVIFPANCAPSPTWHNHTNEPAIAAYVIVGVGTTEAR